MAGHSHAKNVMHRKAAQGAKKAQAFGKLIREITVSAKIGMPDPAANPRLRAAVKAALTANMTRDTIDRAIKRAVTAGQGEDYEEVRYEGYGAHGIAIIAEALTDNRNRTGGDLRSMFAKNGGALGETNSVAFQFERKGVLRYKPEIASADAMLEAAIEAGAEDVESTEDGHEISTCPAAMLVISAPNSRISPCLAKLWRSRVSIALMAPIPLQDWRRCSGYRHDHPADRATSPHPWRVLHPA